MLLNVKVPILRQMIAKATHQTDERLGPHVEEFRQNRIKNPRYKPSWVEAYDHGKTLAYHEELMAKAHASVDCGPPANAMQYRKFLRNCEYTQGGFKRVNTNRPVHLTLPRVDNVPPGMMPRLSPSELEQQAEDLQGKYSQMLFNTQVHWLQLRAVLIYWSWCRCLEPRMMRCA